MFFLVKFLGHCNVNIEDVEYNLLSTTNWLPLLSEVLSEVLSE